MGRLRQEAQVDDPLAEVWLIMPLSLHGAWRSMPDESSLNVHVLDMKEATNRLLLSKDPNLTLMEADHRRWHLYRLLSVAYAADELRILLPPERSPNLVRHADSLIQELKQAGISPNAFQTHSEMQSQPHLLDLALLYRNYEDLLQRDNLWDLPRTMAHICALATTEETNLGFPTCLAVAGLDAFSQLEQRLLAVVRRHATHFALFLPAAEKQLATELATTLELPSLVKPLPAEQSTTVPDLQHWKFATPEQEARHVLRSVKRRHLEEGIPLQYFRINLPSPEPYSSLLRSCADEYGLPLALATPLVSHPLTTALRQLLHLAPDFPWHATWDLLDSPLVRQSFFSKQDLAHLRDITAEGQVIEGVSQWENALQWAEENGREAALVSSLRGKLSAFQAACTPPTGDAQTLLTWVSDFLADRNNKALVLQLPPAPELQAQVLAQLPG